MLCQYQYYRSTKELKTAVAHSDEKYQCEEMSDCPYTGTTVIEKEPWGDWPAGQEEDTEEEDTDSEDEDLAAQRGEENVEMAGKEEEEEEEE